ncbi:MAG: hypothetical protein AABX00_05740 [Nanoarchaeota archaeon]
MPQDDLEAELERAFEGFQATRLVDIMGGTHRSNPTVGRTPLVVLIEDHSNPNLENMIAYLERNKGKMPYSELVDKHIEIVRYFTRIAHLQIPGVQELREQELEALSSLYKRQEQQRKLEEVLAIDRAQLIHLKESGIRMDALSQILYNHLFANAGELVRPEERDRLLNDSSVRLAALRFYSRETGEGKVESASGDAGTQLVRLNSSATGLQIRGSNLREKVAAYLTVGYFLGYFERQISGIQAKIEDTKAKYAPVKLSPDEELKLREFESGGHKKYSPSSYFAMYTNSVWAQVLHFIRESKKAGANVNINL